MGIRLIAKSDKLAMIKCLKEHLKQKQQQIIELNKQLKEKNKEIERLKVFEKAYYYNQLQASQEDIQKFQNLANQSAVDINHIAIQALEEVKELLLEESKRYPIVYDITNDTIGGAIDKDKIFEIIDNEIKKNKKE